MKSITGPDSAVLTGLASIHLVNLSTMTSKYFFLWVPPLRGPTMSSPQTAKGQVMGIVWRAVGGIWLWFAKSWQPTHRWTRSSASARAVGQEKPVWKALLTRALAAAWWP